MIVPPVLNKSSLAQQPLLELVWRRAFETLLDAEQVIFVGYSLPTTDLISQFLFEEAISADCEIRVVNCADNKTKEKQVRRNYRESFPNLRYDQFDFSGASSWADNVKYWGD